MSLSWKSELCVITTRVSTAAQGLQWRNGALSYLEGQTHSVKQIDFDNWNLFVIMLHLEVGNTDKPQLSMVCYDCLEFLSWTVRMRSTSAMIICFVFCFKVHTSAELCSATGKLWLDFVLQTNLSVWGHTHTHTHKRKIAMCATAKQDISRFVMRNKFVLLCSYLRTELKQFLWSRLVKICRQVITFHSSIYTNIHFMSITKKNKWRPENYSKQDVKQQSPSLRRLIPERVAPPPDPLSQPADI